MKAIVVWLISLGWLALAPVASAATLLEPVTIGYSTFSGAYLPLWIAVEERLGAKHGLDLPAIYAGSSTPRS